MFTVFAKKVFFAKLIFITKKEKEKEEDDEDEREKVNFGRFKIKRSFLSEMIASIEEKPINIFPFLKGIFIIFARNAMLKDSRWKNNWW